MNAVDSLVEQWQERLRQIHPMVFDGCEDSRKNFLTIVEEYRKTPHDGYRQEIEMLLNAFEISSIGWEMEIEAGK